ncbi:MAG: hypothetical protein ACK5H4_06045 [Lacrimispora sphenoides]
MKHFIARCIYINQGEPCQAAITSANFTIKGLRLNHETGVVIADKEILQGKWQHLVFHQCKWNVCKKREHYNSRISAGEKIKILFAVDKVIAYSAEIMQLYPNEKPTLCPESGRVPAGFSEESRKLGLRLRILTLRRILV